MPLSIVEPSSFLPLIEIPEAPEDKKSRDSNTRGGDAPQRPSLKGPLQPERKSVRPSSEAPPQWDGAEAPGEPDPPPSKRKSAEEIPESFVGVKKVPFEVEAMFVAVNTAQGRCGLLAGFTYYELSRQSGPSLLQDEFSIWPPKRPAYVLTLLLAFSFAVTSAALATFVRVYLRRVAFDQWSEYAEKTRGIANLSYRCFLLSAYLWICAMSMMGEVYNGEVRDTGEAIMVGDYNAPGEYLTLLPFIVFHSMGGLALVYLGYSTWVFYSVTDEVDDTAPTSSWDDKVDLALQSAQAIRASADGTMYLLGFTGAGLARYNYLQAVYGNPQQAVLNLLFWLFMVVGGASLAFVMVCGTHTAVILETLPPGRRKAAFRRLGCFQTLAHFALRLGLFCVFTAGALIGWGVSNRCGNDSKYIYTCTQFAHSSACATAQTTDPICFANVAWISASIGAIGLATVCVLWIRILLFYRASVAEHEVQRRVSATTRPLRGKFAKENIGSAVAQMTDTWASQASLFSGFVFYNLACFDTDILASPITAHYKLGHTMMSDLFLAVTMGSFTFGMSLVVIAGQVAAPRQFIKSTRLMQIYAEKVLPIVWWMALLRRLSMYCFMASFSLIGFVKMVPFRPEPMIVTLAGLVLLASDERMISEQYKDATRFDGTLADLGDWLDHTGVAHKNTYTRVQAQMKVMTPHALFFGAFCYNGVNFLFRPEALLAPMYATVLAICFVMALTMLLKDGTITSKFVQLEHSEAKKERFSRYMTFQLRSLYGSSKTVPLVFMSGIMLMGPVKLWYFNVTTKVVCPASLNTTAFGDPTDIRLHMPDLAPNCQQLTTQDMVDQEMWSSQYGWLISVGGLLGLLGSWTFNNYLEGRAIKASQQSSDDDGVPVVGEGHHFGSAVEVDPYDDVKTDAEIRTGSILFQTGNVFYEVLFTTINKDIVFANVMYVGLSVATLTLGCVAIVLGSGISFWMDDFQAKKAKSLFARDAQPIVGLLFYLYYTSLVTWLSAMAYSSVVKYEKWWFLSASTSVGALVLIHLGWLCLWLQQRDLERAPLQSDGTDSSQIVWKEVLDPLIKTLSFFFRDDTSVIAKQSLQMSELHSVKCVDADGRPIAAGTQVEILRDFQGDPAVGLLQGQQGIVQQLDYRGNAWVVFDCCPEMHGVLHQDFEKLRVTRIERGAQVQLNHDIEGFPKNVELKKGQKGDVHKVEPDGPAWIVFDCCPELHGVYRKDFQRLRVLRIFPDQIVEVVCDFEALPGGTIKKDQIGTVIMVDDAGVAWVVFDSSPDMHGVAPENFNDLRVMEIVPEASVVVTRDFVCRVTNIKSFTLKKDQKGVVHSVDEFGIALIVFDCCPELHAVPKPDFVNLRVEALPQYTALSAGRALKSQQPLAICGV